MAGRWLASRNRRPRPAAHSAAWRTPESRACRRASRCAGARIRPPLIIGEIAKPECRGDQVERGVGDGKLRARRLRTAEVRRWATLPLRRHQHGMTKVAAENIDRQRCALQRQRQIAGAAADDPEPGRRAGQECARRAKRFARANSGRYSSTASDSAGRNAARCVRTCRAPRPRLAARSRLPAGVVPSVSLESASQRFLDGRGNEPFLHVGGDLHRADALRQHEMDLALARSSCRS